MRRIIAIFALFVISLALQAYIEPQETKIIKVSTNPPIRLLDEDKDFASGELDEAPGFQPDYAKRTGKI